MAYNIVRFTFSQNWVVPAGVTSVDVFYVGGGGRGAGDFTTAGHSGSGGNGGVVNYTPNFSVTPGATIAVTVGAGGTGGANGNGNSGGSSSFGSVTAAGGYGGVDPQPTQQTNSGRGGIRGNASAQTAGKGGDGIACPFYTSGNKYGAGGAGANSAYNMTSIQQYGGTTGGGNSGYGTDNTSQNKGQNATFYGGGGGGGAFSSAHTYSFGGNGYVGIVIISY